MTRSFASIRLAFICGMLSLISVAKDARADEPEQLILLSNGNVLKGLAIPQGDLVIIERDNGSQLRLQRDQVIHTADSVAALYEFRCQHRTFRSSASHVDMAKWCLRNGLIEQAQLEINELIRLDPSHPERIRLERQLSVTKASSATVEVRAMPVASAPEPPPVTTIELPEGISSGAIAEFATRVQPMLINRCGNAGCHRTGSDAKWQLSHLGVNVRVSATMTQRNINATLAHIKLDDPLSSDLLRYATTNHGSQSSKLSGAGIGYSPSGHIARSAEQTLRHWLSQLGRYPQPLVSPPTSITMNRPEIPSVQQVSGNAIDRWPVVPAGNPILTPNTADLPPEGFSVDEDGEWIYDPDGEFAAPMPVSSEESNEWPSPVLSTPEQPANQTPRPVRLPTLNDPFSAELFNRQSQRTAPSASPK
jgi:hypothetical protein